MIETRKVNDVTNSAIDWTLIKKNFETASESLIGYMELLGRNQKPERGPRVILEPKLNSVTVAFRDADKKLHEAIDSLIAENRRLRAELATKDSRH